MHNTARERGRPTSALEPTASSFGSATLRLRFRRRLTAGVRPPTQIGRSLKSPPRRGPCDE